MLIRDATDADSEAVIRVIEAVFTEYPGCVLDVDGEEPHLRRVASAFAAWGGRFWVAEEAGRVVACCGYRAVSAGDGAELKHLYVQMAAREAGLGNTLTEMVEREVVAAGAHFIELWTDTRFAAAHRLYERRGYVRGAETRELNDVSRSVELYFLKQLRRPVGPGGARPPQLPGN